MTSKTHNLNYAHQHRHLTANVRWLSEILVMEFVHGGHMMALGAVSGGLLALVATGQSVAWDIVLMIYLTFEPIYIYDRWQGYQQDYADNQARNAYLGRYLHWMPVIIGAYLVALLLLGLLTGNETGLLICAVLLVFGLAYGRVFKQWTKTLPLFKNIYVALFWLAAGLVIVIFSAPVVSVGAWLVLAFVFLLSVKIQSFFDFKDVRADQEAGLKTLPVLVGDTRALTWLMVLTPLMLLPVLVGVWAGTLGLPALSLCVSVPVSWLLLHKARSGLRRSYLVVMGAEYLLLLAVVAIVSLITSTGM